MSLDERARSEEVEEPKKRLVEVFFATNRDVRKTEDVYKRFGGGRNEAINYGIAEVSVPVNRAAGTLAVPRRFWQFRDWYENDSMFLLKALEPLRDRAGWLERLREQVAIGRGRELLLFVHGFNTEFWEAVLRAAQLHADLGIDGATAVYSWPSRGSAALYDADRTTIDVFRTALQGLIADLAEPFAPGAGSDPVKPRLIIVAHSMGCDYTLKALERLVLQLPAGGLAGGAPLISEVIFAAPDVDLSVFKRDVVTVAPLASRVTAYCSEADVALWLSRTAVHRFERAGRKAEALAGLGLDGIDTTLAAGSRLLEFAHNDYATTTLVDLKAILCGDKPEQRLHLAPANVAAGTYWGMMPKMLKTSEGQVYAMSVDARRGTSALSEPFTM
jgi:esterase/lipase superfamily enzyme